MRWVRRRDLGLALEADGSVTVRARSAGVGARVPPIAVGILAFFSEPRTVDDAIRAFGPPAEGLVRALVEAGLLVTPDRARETPVFFDNFASLDTHRRMLADTARLEAYRRALDEVVREGAAVLDAGTGTGVLAVLAARAGATRVEAVDRGEMAEEARGIVEDSGLAGTVRVHRADFAEVRVDPVDVVVTETFGALALAEGAAPDVARCVAANLAPGGVVVPHAVSLHLAPVLDPAAMAPLRAPWRVPGVDLSRLARAQEHRAVTRAVDPDHLGPARVLARVGFPGEAERVRGRVRFDGVAHIHGLCGWFTLHLSPSVDLPTGPSDPPTHWQQTLLPLDLRCGGWVALDLSVEPAPDDRRGLVVRARWEAATGGGQREWRVR